MKEGDANSKFFTGLCPLGNAKKCYYFYVNKWDAGRGGSRCEKCCCCFFSNHFSNHFKKVDTYRPGLGELMFKSIDDVEGADLIKPFLMEEIKEAVYECDRFKSPWPDDIKLGIFFKDFWDMLKVDLLIFFCEVSRSWKVDKRFE